MQRAKIVLNLDFQNRRNAPPLNVRRLDTAWRFVFALFDAGEPYPLDGCRVSFQAVKPDGTSILDWCVTDGSTAYYDTTEQLTAVDGMVDCKLCVYGEDGNRLNSKGFCVYVEDWQEASGLESTTEVPLLESLIDSVRKLNVTADEAANQAKTSETNAKESEKNAANAVEEVSKMFNNAAKETTVIQIAENTAGLLKDSTGHGMVDVMERQNQLLAAIAAGNASAEFIDNCFMQLLDGTNTTSVFWAWWPLSNNGVDTRYRRLERFGRMLANAWSGKTYTLRGYSAEVSSDSRLTPMDDLAGRSAAVLATDTEPGGVDWAEEDPMTWYIRANALSLSDGTMDVTAVEGEAGFDITGETAPVYTFALALWHKKSDDGSYEWSSWRTTKAAGYYPYAGDVAPDNTKRILTWHPSFGGGLTADGKLTSGAGKACCNFTSATAGLTAARKWDAYEGLWCDCDTEWMLDMWALRHWNKENSGILEGCTNYNYQYKAALAETGVRRILLTTAQAANLVAGSTVSLGDATTNTNLDRGSAYMRDIADKVKISSIASVTVDGTEYAAVNLELEDAIDVTATTYISTMPWHRGSTEAVPDHKDGCIGSLTNGKYPARIAGVEVLDGAYVVGLDPLYNVTANTAGGFDYAVYQCRDSVNLSGSITANYEDTGIKLTGIASGWQYIKAFVLNKLGVVIPRLLGGSSSGWLKSAFYGANSAGVRCPWRWGSLNDGGFGGLACESGSVSPGGAGWHESPRLSGSGKKRGEWTA